MLVIDVIWCYSATCFLMLNSEVGELEQKIEELLDNSDMTPEELADLLNEEIDSVKNEVVHIVWSIVFHQTCRWEGGWGVS